MGVKLISVDGGWGVEEERWCNDWGVGNNTWKLRNENNGIVERV